MAKGDLIKVAGYTKKVVYNGNIEYRPFSPDLVGNQQTNRTVDGDESTSIFTLGNFSIRVNDSDGLATSFTKKPFTDFYDLTKLNVKENIDTLIKNNVNLKLNIDYTNINNFAYFGSANEFIRVSLENIISTWPASIYVSILNRPTTGYTAENYVYDSLTNTSTFSIPTESIDNKYELIYNTSGDIVDTFSSENKLRNLIVNHKSYVVYYNDIEYKLLNFTGSKPPTNYNINLTVEGAPFGTTGSTGLFETFHVKPNKLKLDEFFNGLSVFESNLLNRQIIPQYTSTFKYKQKLDNGIVINGLETLTWTTSDGYNLDFDNSNYLDYVDKLIRISENSDNISSDLISRFLVSESITNFDTIPRLDGTSDFSESQKMQKILRIYGREFDEVKLWIDGIKTSNRITYDKLGNAPDQMVKDLAYTMGWELSNSFINNDLLSHYVESNKTSYSGHSVGLTPQEIETEMWRRLILNTSFLFKSKGSRKAIEFFMKFIGSPKGLIDLNEYVYRVKDKIDMDIFYKVLEYYGLGVDISNYSIDADGYPRLQTDTLSNNFKYFQSKGGWYKESYGDNSSEHELKGNNPHIGPYDGGTDYFNQLTNLIPELSIGFSSFTINNDVNVTGTTNIFYNYNKGVVNDSGNNNILSTNASWIVNYTFGNIWVLGNNVILGDYTAQVKIGSFIASTYIDEFSNQHTIIYPVLSSSYDGTNTTIVPDWNTHGFRPIVSSSGVITITGQIVRLYSESSYINITNKDNLPIDDLVKTAVTIQDGINNARETKCGCKYGKDDMLSICIDAKPIILSGCDDELSTKTYISSGPQLSGTPYIWLYSKKAYYDDNTEITGITIDTIFRNQECCKKDGGFSYLHELYDTEYNSDTKLYQSIYRTKGYVCSKSEGVIKNLEKSGCGCFLTCKWRLTHTNNTGTDFDKQGIQITDITFIYDKKIYLKFISPKNSWGTDANTSTEYKVANPSDSCFCPLNISTPEWIDDGGNNVGYACRVKPEYENLNQDSVLNTYKELIKKLYNKSIGKAPCI